MIFFIIRSLTVRVFLTIGDRYSFYDFLTGNLISNAWPGFMFFTFRHYARDVAGDVVFDAYVGSEIDFVDYKDFAVEQACRHVTIEHAMSKQDGTYEDSYIGGCARDKKLEQELRSRITVEPIGPENVNALSVLQNGRYSDKIESTDKFLGGIGWRGNISDALNDEVSSFRRYRVTVADVPAGVSFQLTPPAIRAFTLRKDPPFNGHVALMKLVSAPGDKYFVSQDILRHPELAQSFDEIMKREYEDGVWYGRRHGATLIEHAKLEQQEFDNLVGAYTGVMLVPSESLLKEDMFTRSISSSVFVNDANYSSKNGVSKKTVDGQNSDASAGSVPIQPGSRARYTLQVKNTGDITLTGATVTIDGVEVPISWAKAQRNGAYVDVDIAERSADLSKVLAPGEVVYIGVEESHANIDVNGGSKNIEVSFADGTSNTNVVEYHTYQE